MKNVFLIKTNNINDISIIKLEDKQKIKFFKIHQLKC